MKNGIEYVVECYITSDSEGLDTVLRISTPSPKMIATLASGIEEKPDHDPATILSSLGQNFDKLAKMANDWRFMTKAEIADHKQSEG